MDDSIGKILAALRGVPLMVRVPGMASQGSISSTPVNLVQLVATLTELCGLDVPSGLEGESFVRDLRSPDRTRDTPMYAEFALSSPKGGRSPAAWARI